MQRFVSEQFPSVRASRGDHSKRQSVAWYLQDGHQTAAETLFRPRTKSESSRQRGPHSEVPVN
jgi:hypothetical protein